MIAVIAVVSTAALFPACACNGAGAAEKFIENVVSISSSGSNDKYGSGVLVCREGDTVVCLTNYHVVSDNYRILVTPADGNTVSAELLGYSEYHDVAVLGLTADHGQKFADLRADGRFAAAEKGEAYSVGDKGRSGVKVYAGECTAASRVIAADTVGSGSVAKYVPVAEFTCDIGAGMSGCAVLDGSGKLVALGAYGDEDKDVYYGVASAVARAVMDAALRGEVGDNGEVALLGVESYGAFLTGAYGEASLLAKRNSELHPLGFAGTFMTDGFLVKEIGADCPLPADAVVTELGGAKVRADNINAVFAALYGCRITESAEADALTVKYTLDGAAFAARLAGGGAALTSK